MALRFLFLIYISQPFYINIPPYLSSQLALPSSPTTKPAIFFSPRTYLFPILAITKGTWELDKLKLLREFNLGRQEQIQSEKNRIHTSVSSPDSDNLKAHKRKDLSQNLPKSDCVLELFMHVSNSSTSLNKQELYLICPCILDSTQHKALSKYSVG